MSRKKLSNSRTMINHRIFSTYSFIISCIYMLRVVFELASTSSDIDVQWQVSECLFVVFGVLISLAMHNAYDARISFISILWLIWMFFNTILALFIVNSDIIQLVIRRVETSQSLSIIDILKACVDVLHFLNIPISLYLLCVYMVSSKTTKRRQIRRRKRKHSDKRPIVKKQFEVANVFIGDEMVYYV